MAHIYADGMAEKAMVVRDGLHLFSPASAWARVSRYDRECHEWSDEAKAICSVDPEIYDQYSAHYGAKSVSDEWLELASPLDEQHPDLIRSSESRRLAIRGKLYRLAALQSALWESGDSDSLVSVERQIDSLRDEYAVLTGEEIHIG